MIQDRDKKSSMKASKFAEAQVSFILKLAEDGVTIAGMASGVGELAICVSVLAFGAYRARLDMDALRTLAFVAIVFGNQATTCTNRKRRRLWSSRPSAWLFSPRQSPTSQSLLRSPSVNSHDAICRAWRCAWQAVFLVRSGSASRFPG